MSLPRPIKNMSLRAKLMASVVAIALIIAGVGAAVDYSVGSTAHAEAAILSLREQAGALRAAREQFSSLSVFIEYVKSFCHETTPEISPGHHIYILDADKKLLASSHPQHSHHEIEQALLSSGAAEGIIALSGHRLAQVRTRASDGTIIAVVEYLDAAEAEVRSQVLSRAITATAIALGAMLILFFTINHWVLTPASRLAETAKAWSRQELSVRAPVTGTADMCSLAAEFNSMAEALEARTQELQRSNKELEQFGYVVSHDLKEPLRAVTGFVTLLEKHWCDRLDAKSKEYMGFITDGTRRMDALITDLLRYARAGAQTEPPKPVNSGKCFELAVENLRAAIEEAGASVTADGLPQVLASERDLMQVFQNLIGNAVKFHGREPPRVRVNVKKDGRFWTFEVRDNGLGIPRDQAERVFQVFRRLHTRDEYPGTGIGLAICKKVVERHGGRISVESEPGQGSAFFFTIPACEVPAGSDSQ